VVVERVHTLLRTHAVQVAAFHVAADHAELRATAANAQ
jgi:hypothetical protein